MATATVIHPNISRASAPASVISRVKPPEAFMLVLFGATGDLAGRKLLPALCGLLQNKFLPKDFVIVAVGRREKTDQAFRDDIKKDLAEFRKGVSADDTSDFLGHVFYQRSDFTTPEGMKGIAARLHDLERERNLPGNRLFYLATDPEFFRPIVERLAGAGLVRREEDRPWARVVIEKPFGHDLASAVALDRDLLRFLRPDQIYRIDHYLGKETVQNLLAFRFHNAVFEPLFHREHVDHIPDHGCGDGGHGGPARAGFTITPAAPRRRAESHAAALGPDGDGPAGDARSRATSATRQAEGAA